MNNGNDIVANLRLKLESLETDYQRKKQVLLEAIDIFEADVADLIVTDEMAENGRMQPVARLPHHGHSGGSNLTLKSLVMEFAKKHKRPFSRIHVGEYLQHQYPLLPEMNDQGKISNTLQKLKGDESLIRVEVGNPSFYIHPEYHHKSG